MRKDEYYQDLLHRLERVYSQPLMFERDYKPSNKKTKNNNYNNQETNEEELNDQEYDYQNYNTEGNESEVKQHISHKISNLKEEDEEEEN